MRAAAPFVASLGAMLALWSAAAVWGDAPAPWRVADVIWRETLHGPLLGHVGSTLSRVVAAFTVSMLIGSAIGYAMGRSRVFNAAFDAWLIVLLNLPALVVMTLCYIWIGLNETAAIAAVAINKIPLVAAMTREGARALDPALDDMAQVFRMSRWTRLRHVILPQMAPHLAASARAGLALIWKIVLVVELLGRPNGVGFQIHMYFSLFDVTYVLAYALAFVIVMLAIEKALMQPLERAARRWRDTGL